MGCLGEAGIHRLIGESGRAGGVAVKRGRQGGLARRKHVVSRTRTPADLMDIKRKCSKESPAYSVRRTKERDDDPDMR